MNIKSNLKKKNFCISNSYFYLFMPRLFHGVVAEQTWNHNRVGAGITFNQGFSPGSSEFYAWYIKPQDVYIQDLQKDRVQFQIWQDRAHSYSRLKIQGFGQCLPPKILVWQR